MQLKLFITLMFTVAGTVVGYLMYKKDREKELYFSGLKGLATSLICDIRFTRSDIGRLVSDFQSGSELLQKHKEQFVVSLEQEGVGLEKAWLKEPHYITVKEFFYNLGRFDVDTQIFQLEASRDKLGLIAEEMSEHNKKVGKMKIKLGLLFGLALGILLL